MALAAAGLLTVLLASALAPLAVAGHENPATTAPETLAVTLPFAAVGLLIARRQPRNPVGWLMLCFAVGFLLSIDAGSYDLADYRFGAGLPLGPVSLLLYVLWEPALVLGPLAVLLFPDGRLPSARWRWPLRVYLAVGCAGRAVHRGGPAFHPSAFRARDPGHGGRFHAGRGGAVQPAAAAGSADRGPAVQPGAIQRRAGHGGVRYPAQGSC